uniref:Uncharacterized protein n=1 Tax=Nymphaea colorata TaxID=210225 RepID=A0A5K1GTW0_9MAGN
MTTSTGCTIFPRHHHKHNSMAGERPPTTCWRIDRVALWLGSTIATFFFSTLDRCSCINIPTADDVDDGTGEAKTAPLIPRSEVGTEPFATSTAESPFRYRRKGRMKKVRVGFSFGLMRRKVGKPSSFRI